MPIAPTVGLFGPVNTPPRASLLENAEVIEYNEEDRFGGKLEVLFERPDSGVSLWFNEDEDNTNPKLSDGGDLLEFETFDVAAGETCSTYSIKDPKYYEKRALRKLKASLPKKIENALWTGAGITSNPRLANTTSTDLTANTATDIEIALALLEEGIGDNSDGQRAMIHVPAYSMTRLLTRAGDAVNSFVDPQTQKVRYETAMGNIIVPGYGYTGSAPNGDAPTSSAEWIYATPIVTVLLGPISIFPDTLGQAVNIRDNNITFYAERTVATVFNHEAFHLAARVKRTG